MHGPTRNRLEELITATGDHAPVEPEIRNHLDSCAECQAEITQMRTHAELLKTLQAPAELEPAPGFYARVLQRIEERAKRSIWYGLVYSPFGKRLAYASLSLALLLGLYVIAAEHSDHDLTRSYAVRLSPEVSGASNPDEQRDAVLVNFASYSVSSGEAAE